MDEESKYNGRDRRRGCVLCGLFHLQIPLQQMPGRRYAGKSKEGSWECDPSCGKLEGIDLKREPDSTKQCPLHLSPLTPSIQGPRYGSFDEKVCILV